ncbi:MAG: AAA family ATPase [Candidatus Sedimenticola sp. (ex Thyasira tokunagai)]
MEELHDLELLLSSRTPIIIIESLEELRLLELFARIGLRLDYPMFQWTVTEGLKRLEADFPAQKLTAGPDDVLKHIKALSRPGYFLLLDFHPYLQDPIHVRLIKEIAQGHELIPRTLILLSHAIDIPPELRHLTARFDLQLPDRAGIKRLIIEEAKQWQGKHRRKVEADQSAIKRLATTLTGVTATDARRLIRNAIEDDGAISRNDLPKIMQAKYELLGKGGVISFEYDTADFTDVAGLEHLKKWLSHRHKAFNGNPGALDRPKGIMLLGVQGAGKSLAAKAVAGTFGVPLLRLDFAALYNKYIGETEKNLRHALVVAETMAPCTLWMDEIEKGVAESDSDEGLSRRILGTLLTWMAEQESGVFIVATANDIERLPPELMRKGRLDEIFFIDLPSAEVRRQIFDIHLRRRNLPPSGFDLESLSSTSDGYTGAEIEQAIVSALYAAHARETPLDTPQLLEELDRTSPISVVMAEKIDYLREWASNRTVAAG